MSDRTRPRSRWPGWSERRQRALVRQRARFGREAIEHQREKRRRCDASSPTRCEWERRRAPCRRAAAARGAGTGDADPRDVAQLLRHAVFEQLEVRARQVGDRAALRVAHDDVDHDRRRRGAELRIALLRVRRARRRPQASDGRGEPAPRRSSSRAGSTATRRFWPERSRPGASRAPPGGAPRRHRFPSATRTQARRTRGGPR